MRDRIDLFKISNSSFGWNCDCYGSVQQLRGRERERETERERERERRPVRREEIIPVMIQEQRYISEPIETKYLKF